MNNRKMKAVLVLTFAAVFVLPVFFAQGCGAREEKQEETVVYTCPMHPEVTSDRPGECPVCGMDLVEKQTEETD